MGDWSWMFRGELLISGSVKCWGANSQGQAGSGGCSKVLRRSKEANWLFCWHVLNFKRRTLEDGPPPATRHYPPIVSHPLAFGHGNWDPPWRLNSCRGKLWTSWPDPGILPRMVKTGFAGVFRKCIGGLLLFPEMQFQCSLYRSCVSSFKVYL